MSIPCFSASLTAHIIVPSPPPTITLAATPLDAREDGADLAATHAEALGHDSVCGTEGTDGLHEVTDGREVAALALGSVVDDLVGGGNRVGLEGQVVVGHLVALAGHGAEHTVGGTVETFSELHTHAADGGLEVGGQALLDSLAESLTGGDGGDNALVHVSLHGAGLGTNVGAVLLVGLGDVVGNTGQLLGGTLGTRGVGSDDGGQHGHLGAEALLGTLEGIAGRGGGSAGGGIQRLGGLGVELLHGSHLTVELLGGRLEVGGHLGGVTGVASTELGNLHVETLLESLDLGGGGGLVLVHEGLEA